VPKIILIVVEIEIHKLEDMDKNCFGFGVGFSWSGEMMEFRISVLGWGGEKLNANQSTQRNSKVEPEPP
jgi:hypothetical protein